MNETNEIFQAIIGLIIGGIILIVFSSATASLPGPDLSGLGMLAIVAGILLGILIVVRVIVEILE